MGMAPVAHVLWSKIMRFNPKNADWANRDRFVLSYVYTLSYPVVSGGAVQEAIRS